MSISTVKINLNGQNYDLSYNDSTSKWEASITAPSTTSWNETNNKYGVTVTATDNAGNQTIADRTHATYGSTLQLRVLEKVAPVIALTNPSSGARVTSSTPTFSFTLRDTGSGINLDELVLKIDGGTSVVYGASGLTCTSTTGGYNCTYVPSVALSEGSHTVTITVKDNDGNTPILFSSGFSVDTVPPALNISTPVNNLVTNSGNLKIQGTTNDSTSSSVSVTVELGGVDQGSVTISEGAFSKSITLAEGSNTIIITATDGAGLFTSVTRTVVLDTSYPTIDSVTITPNPVDSGATFLITVKVSD